MICFWRYALCQASLGWTAPLFVGGPVFLSLSESGSWAAQGDDSAARPQQLSTVRSVAVIMTLPRMEWTSHGRGTQQGAFGCLGWQGWRSRHSSLPCVLLQVCLLNRGAQAASHSFISTTSKFSLLWIAPKLEVLPLLIPQNTLLSYHHCPWPLICVLL